MASRRKARTRPTCRLSRRSPAPCRRGNAEAREQFANHYLQHDEFLTREEEAERAHFLKHGKSRSIKIEKRTARLCNVHRFWKITAPIILRRRKDDCGLPIVQKIVQPICIPPGRTQQEVYRFHLENLPLAARAPAWKQVEMCIRRNAGTAPCSLVGFPFTSPRFHLRAIRRAKFPLATTPQPPK